MIKPPVSDRSKQFILRVWVDENGVIQLNRNDQVKPRRSFDTPYELMQYLELTMDEGNLDLFYDIYNHCNMSITDPDIQEEQ
jgi:hypothetical protein